MQLGAWLGLNAPQLAQTLRRRAGVTAVAGVAPQLTADGAGAAALKAGYGPDAPALLAQRCQRHSVFWLQVLVSRSHLRTLLLVRVLHFRFETALSLALNEQKNAVELAAHIDNTTNDLLRREAALLHRNSVEAAKANQRLVIDVDTLKEVQNTLIKTVEDVLKIQKDGVEQRKNAEKQIETMRNDLRARLTRNPRKEKLASEVTI